MKKIKGTLMVLGCLALLGCNAPMDTVIDNKQLVVYHAEQLKDGRLGKYEYYVRDNSTAGWKLISDQQFQVGDVLNITKVQ